jgi:hypothetical protein
VPGMGFAYGVNASLLGPGEDGLATCCAGLACRYWPQVQWPEGRTCGWVALVLVAGTPAEQARKGSALHGTEEE